MNDIDPERRKRIERILDQVLKRDLDQRAALLDQLCSGNAELRADVESLLATDAAGEQIARPLDPTVKYAPSDLNAEDEFIGPFRLLQKIGEGGMGEVWLAEQTEPIRRKVALKVIKHGMDTKQVIARFEAERQALALMNHPNVAKVFDAGATKRHRPYFAMERVKGVPITEHCDRQRLNTNERLELFLQVCDGVQHAHQKGVIHRDIKPSNILVQVQGDKRIPKIIDFGVAKATAQRLTGRTLFTELGQMIGTPEYMSPEQAEMTGEDIDTRTDVYSMGVLLYELLAGALPFDSKELRRVGFDEFRRKIREDEPPRPSTRITTQSKQSGKTAAKRRTDLISLSRKLRGDLDWITMKALEKDRSRRHSSPSELATDIRRHLADEPVHARPPSTAYRARKFVLRNRLVVGFSALLVVSLVAGMVGTRLESVRARREARKAQVISEFLRNMLSGVDPEKAQGKEVTVRDALDEAARKVDRAWTDTPELEVELRTTIGTMYSQLGLYAQAEDHLRRAVELYRTLLGAGHETTLKTTNQLARNLFYQGRHHEAELEWNELLELYRHTGEESPETLTIMNNLGGIYLQQKRYDLAEPLLTKTLEGRRRVLGTDHVGTTATMGNLAQLYRARNRDEEAQALLVEALGIRERILGEDHPRTLSTVFNLGALLKEMGRYAEARPLFEKAWTGFRDVYNDDHEHALEAMANLADTLFRLDEVENAERLAVASYERHSIRLGPEHENTVKAINLLVELYEASERHDEAEAWRSRLPDPLELVGSKDRRG